MNRTRLALLVSSALVAGVAMAAACSEAEVAMPPGVGGGGSGGAADGGGGTGTGGIGFGGDTGCTDDEDCNGGVCNNGVCCGSADLVCADGCCNAGDVCLFDKCVTPGDDCFSAADCPDDHYCEPALGEQSAGGAGGAGGDQNCTQPLIPGKCLPLPEICGEGGGGAGGGDCIEKCEYHPPPGQLNAIEKWQWGYNPPPTEYPASADVWSTPTVARITDANCDGKVDLADPPNIVFISGDSQATCCHCGSCATSPSCCQLGVLRVLDGASGQEIWSLDKAQPGANGFAGVTPAVGDIDGDQLLDIIAVTGDGYLAMIDSTGVVQRISDQPVSKETNAAGFGWGGGVSLGDMDGDGFPEIAYGRSLFETTAGAITRLWVGSGSWGKWNGQNSVSTSISHFVDLDLNGDLELLAGGTAYQKLAGNTLFDTGAEGFSAIGDFDKNGSPEVVLISSDSVSLLNGADGSSFNGWSALALPGSGHGGPPTVADFDGDGFPEIGVAQQNRYSVIKPDFTDDQLEVLWEQTNHDMSSAVTGSSVFDFEGDGKAEVVYNDECYLWVYDGTDGTILFTSFTQSFTATESSIVADVDGDGHAEMLIMANGADPNSWSCAHHDAPGVVVGTHTEAFPVWQPPQVGTDYRGITVLGDAQNSWVGTRTLWNQHAYNVTNICDPRDSACQGNVHYGQIPANQTKNWTLDWLNNFRQNVQDEGLFDAPDVTVTLDAQCVSPVPLTVQVRNIGLAGLPAGVEVGLFKLGPPEVQLTTLVTSKPLLAGQTEILSYEVPVADATPNDTFQARILIDPNNITFNECRDDNNESDPVKPECVQ